VPAVEQLLVDADAPLPSDTDVPLPDDAEMSGS
jgi:hypothetical protein